MKRVLSVVLAAMVLAGLLAIPVSASFQVTYFNEEIYAGGIVDMYVWVSGGDNGEYTYQWQAEGFSGSWLDLSDNASYSGTRTNHLQIHTKVGGDYSEWASIPFRCVVKKGDEVQYSPDIYSIVHPTENMKKGLEKWGYGLYEPTLTNVTGLTTRDYENYTCSAYAGSKIRIFCGSKSVDDYSILRASEVELTPEIHITEDGKTTVTGWDTTYIPYTVGTVTMEIKLPLKIGGTDLGIYDAKTIRVTTTKPEPLAVAKTKSACSLLRYTYNESQKLASIPMGASVEVLTKDGSYYQVFYNNRVGYVGASLLDVDLAQGDAVIKEVDLNIPAPVAGEKPAFTCEFLTKTCQLYKTDPISWYDRDEKRFLTATDKFREGHSYDLSIWVQAKSGYRFQTDSSGNPKLSGVINGNLPPFIYKAYEQDPEKVVELTYTFYNTKKAPEHVCTLNYVSRVAPTCTESGREAYYYCACGKTYADRAGNLVDLATWGILPATGHTPSAWRTTQLVHYKACTTCGEFLTEEDHTGGTALCERQAICQVCQTPYGSFGSHTYETKWTSMGEQGHAHLCTGLNCGTHDTVVPHTPGPEATDQEPQICTDCGFILQPAKNHTHNLTKVPQKAATCTQEGNYEYYACSGCSVLFKDEAGKEPIPSTTSVTLGALGHKTSESWQQDTQYHWRTCERCREVLEETRMLHDMESGKCATCGYVEGTDPVTSTVPPTTPAVEQGSKEDGSADVPKSPISPLAAVLVGSLSFSVAIVTTVIILKKKKR